jgi:large repetitive protein
VLFSRRQTFLFLLGCLLPGIASSPAKAQTASIANAGAQPSIRLEHTTHPLATPASSAGRVEADKTFQRMLFVLTPSAEQEAQLKQLLADQQNPRSPNYHHWLTAKAFGAQFGPADGDVQKARAWLESAGFTVTQTAASKRWLEFSGSSGQVESAFQTQMQYFRVRGRTYVANASDLAIPASLAGISRGVASLNNFGLRPPVHTATGLAGTNAQGQKIKLTPNLTAAGATDTTYYMAPGDFAAIYNTKALLSSGVDGTGITIAIAAQSDIEITDQQQFRQIFQLPSNDPNVFVSGPDPGLANEVDADESLLDVEWAGAVAPSATIDLVVAGSTDTTPGVNLAAAYIIDSDLAPILTFTYGSCEQALGTTGNAFFNALWEQAAAEGITVVVSAGDNGAAGCDNPNAGEPAQYGPAVNGVAATPFNLAVGGSEFADSGNPATFWSSANAANYSSAIGYIPENAWNESCDPGQPTSATNCVFGNGNFSLLSAAGGVSTLYAKPTWQTGAGVPADGARDVPDVVLAAASEHDEAVYCTSLAGNPCQLNAAQQLVNLTLVGGTSVSTPAMAGILALVEQKNGAYQGQVDYLLYRFAQTAGNTCSSTSETNPSTSNSCVFYDITSGSNAVPCAGRSSGCSSVNAGVNGMLTGFAAGPGYDAVTGLGSVNAANLAAAWNASALLSSQITLQTPSISIAHGTTVPLNGAVSATTGTGTPTGAVAFLTDLSTESTQTATLSPTATFAASISDLPGGQYNLHTHYAGDSSFAASDSSPVPVTVTPENSETTLTANGSTGGSAAYGAAVQIKATVAGLSGNGIATGSVSMRDTGNSLGTFSLSSDGSANISLGTGSNASLATGTHSLAATYSGDSSFNASSSAPVSFIIGKGTPMIVVGVNTASLPAGETLGAHVVIAGGGSTPATGTIQFTVDGGATGAPVTLTAGGFFGTGAQASTLISNLTQGTHVIGAAYNCGGDLNYTSVASGDPHNELMQTVTVNANAGASTTTTLSVSPAPTTIGSTGNFKVTVAPKTATGAVTIWDAVGPRSASTAISGGSASIQFAWTQAGTTSVYAVYSGDANNAASASAPTTFTVQPGVPQVTIMAPASTSSTAQMTLNTSVIGNPSNPQMPQPTGAVQLLDSLNGSAARVIGTQTLTSGPGGISVTALRFTLAAGTHSLSVHYLGDTNWRAANSTPEQVTSGSFTLGVSPNPIVFNAGAAGSGTVTITPSGGFNGTVALACATGGTLVPAGYTCSLGASNVGVNGSVAATTPLNLTLTNSTTSSATAVKVAQSHSNDRPLWAGGMAAALMLFVLLGFASGGSKGARNFLLSAGLFFASFAAISACSGGGGSGGGAVSTTTTITSSNLHVASGAPVTFSITVKPNGNVTPSGLVQIMDNGQVFGSPTQVTAGVASYLATSLPIGVNIITAEYLGSANTQPSTSAPITQLIAGTLAMQITGTSGATSETANFSVTLN